MSTTNSNRRPNVGFAHRVVAAPPHMISSLPAPKSAVCTCVQTFAVRFAFPQMEATRFTCSVCFVFYAA